MKKIYAVSLESIRKNCATAVYQDDMLIVTHTKDIVGDPDIWKKSLLNDFEEKNKQGFACLIDDRTRSFSKYATSFSFDTVESDGRTSLQHCFDWYFALSNRGSLILEQDVERYRLKIGGENGLIDLKHDDKGRIIYHANWNALHGGHRAILMCVYAAVMEEPLSDRWINEFLNHSKSSKNKNNKLTSFYAITTGVTIAKQQALEESWRKNNI